MKYCCPNYYFDFVCDADNCTDTCCKYWDVELDREAVKQYGMLIENNHIIGTRLKKAIKGLKNKKFAINKNGSCMFLNECLLCDLHSAVGHENLPRTCRLYPRYINNFGGYEERGLSFSCPAAVRLILDGGFNTVVYEDDTAITEFIDIDAIKFMYIKDLRNQIIYELSNRENYLGDIIQSVLNFLEKSEEALSLNKYEKVALKVEREQLNLNLYKKLQIPIIKEHLKHKHLRYSFRQKLINTLNGSSFNINEDVFRTWLVYFVQRYLIKAVFDNRLLALFKAGILSYVVISSLEGDITDNIQKYSKETEHNEYNLKRLFAFAEKIDITQIVVDKNS